MGIFLLWATWALEYIAIFVKKHLRASHVGAF